MVPEGSDPFIAGVQWAGQTYYNEVFGDLLGPPLWDFLGPQGTLLNPPQIWS